MLSGFAPPPAPGRTCQYPSAPGVEPRPMVPSGHRGVGSCANAGAPVITRSSSVAAVVLTFSNMERSLPCRETTRRRSALPHRQFFLVVGYNQPGVSSSTRFRFPFPVERGVLDRHRRSDLQDAVVPAAAAFVVVPHDGVRRAHLDLEVDDLAVFL